MALLVTAGDAPTLAQRGKDAASIALIALLLGIPMIGLTTVDQGGALQVETRWPLLAGFVAVVFGGRLLVRYVLDWLLQRRRTRERQRAKTDAPASLGAVRGGRTITVCQGDAYAVRGGTETHCATMVATMMRVETASSA